MIEQKNEITYNPQTEIITLSGNSLRLFKDIQKEVRKENSNSAMEDVLSYTLQDIQEAKQT